MTPERLFEQNQGLAHQQVHQWQKSFPQYLWDDLESVALLGLWKSCLKFDPSRGFAFSTFAVRVIINELNMFYRAEKRRGALNDLNISLQAEIKAGNPGDDPLTLENILGVDEEGFGMLELNETLGHLLDSRERKVIALKHYYGFDQRSIAESIGYSQAHVSRILSKVRKKLQAV